MPIQSTPVTTRSTINLSDIIIDTDLDMGANKINLTNLSDLLINSNSAETEIETLIQNKIPDLVLNPIDKEISFPYKMADSLIDDNEYSVNSSSWTTKISMPLTLTGDVKIGVISTIKAKKF